jgi:hypothetical protein
MVLGTSLPDFNPDKFPLLEPNCLVGGTLAQLIVKKQLLIRFLAYPAIGDLVHY